MLFSTCKGPLINELEAELGFEFVKKMEIGDGAEFTHDFLMDQLHPAKSIFKTKFDRPKKPGKGSRRLLRSTESGTPAAEEDED